MNHIFQTQHPIWAMAFRPFYLLAALHGIIAILLWGFGYTGTTALPAHLWHAHEMIWGYAGAIVVAFLLTAVATWTQQPPTRGITLIILLALWLAARLTAFLPTTLPTAILGTAFFALGTLCMARPVIASRNTRNFIAVIALLIFGGSHLLFHIGLFKHSDHLTTPLISGLLLVGGFIGLIGNRIIPFFTARRLNTPQVQTPISLVSAALLLPASAAILAPFAPPLIPSVLLLLAGLLGIIQTFRWFERPILKEPMLWSLHLGYLFSSLGLLTLALAQILPQWQSLGTHLLAVGGIGLLTVSMMTRTALGHTGRPLYPAPQGMTIAFWLMVAAALFRTLAAIMLFIHPTAYAHSLRLSAVLFALSLLLYFWRYRPWLTRPRLDGKAG